MEYENDSLQETGYLGAVFLSWLFASVVTLVFFGVTDTIGLPNIVLIFLLATFLLALRYGRRAGLVSAILNVGFFDYFFIPPKFSFTVENGEYLITFLVMLIVGLLTGHLVAKLRNRVEEIQKRQSHMEGLQQFAQKLLVAHSIEEISKLSQSSIAEILTVKTAVYIGQEASVAVDAEIYINPQVKSWCLQSGIKVDEDEGQKKIVSVTYQPIKQNANIIGLIIAIDTNSSLSECGKREILGMATNLVAMAVTRLKTIENEQSTQILIEKERLKNAILSALSHDVRTPLTAMIANAENLLASKQSNEQEVRDGLHLIRDQGVKLAQLMGDLVELSKLQLNQPTLSMSWQPIEEVIGSSIAHFKLSHPERSIIVKIDPNVAPVTLDEVLIERVICNLLENSAQASPDSSSIEIHANGTEKEIDVSILDSGTGIGDGDQMLVDQNKRHGLGLVIARAIVEAHQGTLSLANRRDVQGAIARFTLPL